MSKQFSLHQVSSHIYLAKKKHKKMFKLKQTTLQKYP